MSYLSIQSRIKHITSRMPQKVAIEFGDESFSYYELERNSDQILSFFQSQLGQNNKVLVISEKSPQLVWTVIGLLKVGAVFAPIDPNIPQNRLVYIINELDPQWIITQSKWISLLDKVYKSLNKKINLLVLDTESGIENTNYSDYVEVFYINDESPSNIFETDEIKNEYCYINFTTGSTGKPKSVLGRHSSLAHLIDWEIKELKVDSNSKVSQLTTPSFGPYIRDILVPLCSGGTVCIPKNREILLNSERLVEWVDKSQITILHMVPSLFRLFSEGAKNSDLLKSLKYIFLAGETLRGKDIKNFIDLFKSRIQIINAYGQTESSLIKLFYRVKECDTEKSIIPVGKPIDKTEILLLDKEMNICAHGEIGELYICSDYFSAGYYNDNTLTDSIFKKNPYKNLHGSTLLRTRDSAQILPDGNVQILGRIDHQVKIRV